VWYCASFQAGVGAGHEAAPKNNTYQQSCPEGGGRGAAAHAAGTLTGGHRVVRGNARKQRLRSAALVQGHRQYRGNVWLLDREITAPEISTRSLSRQSRARPSCRQRQLGEEAPPIAAGSLRQRDAEWHTRGMDAQGLSAFTSSGGESLPDARRRNVGFRIAAKAEAVQPSGGDLRWCRDPPMRVRPTSSHAGKGSVAPSGRVLRGAAGRPLSLVRLCAQVLTHQIKALVVAVKVTWRAGGEHNTREPLPAPSSSHRHGSHAPMQVEHSDSKPRTTR